ncbi:hypothetical protein DP113_03970 [Brasilonema octagenarum UFV-E1]|uniref:Uncharacterized protein n=1 Tax=Brasilonema sennae CENA114 TaxID=415709 RepID=A0A856M9Z8_9CYAN|nr:hypothetical protein DP114_04015 [Brasilonema sennae CENA114]QDL13548.1 hypothetical protein DP113_03970 [Brasilonema octagenarum UFV-E1]
MPDAVYEEFLTKTLINHKLTLGAQSNTVPLHMIFRSVKNEKYNRTNQIVDESIYNIFSTR